MKAGKVLAGVWSLTAAAVLAAVVLRLWGITWGLPDAYNADEPHLVNLAVSFGGGSLKPYFFKYPTLWPYVLFASYGFYFLAWSCLGLRHGIGEFAGLFAWQPAGFYLLGRLLAAALSMAALWQVWRMERERPETKGPPWAFLLLAFSPTVVEAAHACKPDCLMFLLACAGWRQALAVQREGERRAYWFCGLFLGLAVSTQYTAIPAAAALPLAHALGTGRRRGRWLAEGLGAMALGFLLGTPYAVLDFPRFWEGLRDTAAMGGLESWDRASLLRQVLANLGGFGGPGSLAGLAALAGAARLSKRNEREALLLIVPILLYVVFLAGNADGGWSRYLLGAFPALALLAAEGLRGADRPRRFLWTAGLALLALAPGAWQSARNDLGMTLPDTRAAAKAWVLGHVPQGATLLLDVPHAGPNLPMEREQVEEVWRRTSAAGSPRSRLYRAMADSHPGGGYRLYRILRTARDLRSAPRHVQLSQADSPTLDVSGGLAEARRAGVAYVIISSLGARPDRAVELKGFFDELFREGRLAAEFVPGWWEAGPTLRVFRLVY